jgi:NAD(P)-dependent dehydrogenase (short-subunit alcohol dehydrogenase family)
MNTLQGKVVCITGAAGGIGSALARAFADKGANLALLDINSEALSALSKELPGRRTPPVTVRTAVTDLCKEQDIREGIQQVLSPYDGVIDVLVANVGVVMKGLFEEITAEQWRQAFDINFFTHVYAIQSVLPLMKQRKGGCIILTGSDQGLQPDAGLSPYAAAKAGLHSLTKTLAIELAPYNIRVNAVAPGMTRTPLVEVLMEEYAKEYGTDSSTAEKLELQRRGVPLARLGEPEEVAEAVLYLVMATFCTATILNISGGNVRSVTC